MGGDPRKLGPGTFRGKRDGSRPSPATWKWLHASKLNIRNLVCLDRLIHYIDIHVYAWTDWEQLLLFGKCLLQHRENKNNEILTEVKEI